MSDVDNKRNNKAIGAEIARLRKQRGWSISDLADQAMWLDEEIEAIEGGLELPLGYLDRVAKVLGVSVENLTTGR